jgi:molybdenum cofactor biosynthesis protein MoaC
MFVRFSHQLTHVNSVGKAKMVNVGGKIPTLRTATAQGRIILGQTAFELVENNQMKKGDVLMVAKLAGIQAAKQTANLIPLCHTLQLTRIDVECMLEKNNCAVRIESLVECHGNTGVEMEAITAVSIAACTIYDMCKAINQSIIISDIKLLTKTGGSKSDFKIENGY